jgi:hypothetical protein
LQDPENKDSGFARSRKRWSYGFFGAFGRHKPEAGGFCLDIGLIIRGVSRWWSGDISGTWNGDASGSGLVGAKLPYPHLTSIRGHRLVKRSAPAHASISMPASTGPAGPLPRVNYCNEQCYSKGKLKRSRDCTCKGCQGRAHGRGKQYASDEGYLKSSPPGSRKPGTGQELLPFAENKDLDDLKSAVNYHTCQ